VFLEIFIHGKRPPPVYLKLIQKKYRFNVINKPKKEGTIFAYGNDRAEKNRMPHFSAGNRPLREKEG